MVKTYMSRSDIYDVLENTDLMIDEKYLYRFLSGNSYMTVSGIYEITRRKMCNDTGISKDRIVACVENLVREKLIAYDNNVVFVPRIPEEQKLTSKRGWKDQLSRMVVAFKDHPSDLVSSVNHAFLAFAEYHKEHLYEIEQDGLHRQHTAASESNADESEDHHEGLGAMDQEEAAAAHEEAIRRAFQPRDVAPTHAATATHEEEGGADATSVPTSVTTTAAPTDATIASTNGHTTVGEIGSDNQSALVSLQNNEHSPYPPWSDTNNVAHRGVSDTCNVLQYHSSQPYQS